MNVFLIALIAVTLISARPCLRSFNIPGYIDRAATTRINGIFILIVFYAHARTYIPLNMRWDGWMYTVATSLGQLMVALFLFYSGYGVMESIKHKPGYVRSMPAKRIGVTLANFAIAVTLFLGVDLALGIEIDPARALLAFFGWSSVGNSNWYIFAILVLYALSCLSFWVLRRHPRLALAAMFALTILFTVFMLFAKGSRAAYSYNTVLCYPVGMLYSMYKPQFERFYTKNSTYLLALIVSCCAFVALRNYFSAGYMVYELYAAVYCLIAVQVTLKLEVRSRILHWCGKNLFWIYVLQRLPMLVMREFGFNEAHPYWFVIISFGVTVALTAVMARVSAPLDARIAALGSTKK